jgi:predicted Kef-type K+ transport protein
MSPAAARAHVIHSLETKLETDLKRVEKDAAKATAKDHRHGNHTIDLSPRNLTSRLDKDLVRVRTDVRHLVRAIEAAEMELQVLKQQMLVQQLELQQKKTKMTTEKILDQLHAGKLSVKVDYVTGELVRTNNVHASLRGANSNNNNMTAFVTDNNTTASQSDDSEKLAVSLEEEERITEEMALEDIIASAQKSAMKQQQQQEFDDDETDPEAISSDADVRRNINLDLNDDLRSRVQREIEHLRLGADPATFSIDFELMMDIVKLAMTAAFFGLVAVFLRLPPTAGFLFGGMLIGPSCLELIGSIHEVQTLAQFGIIFLLFEQGLLYSQTYSGAAVLGSTLATGRMEELPESHDAIVSPKSTDKLLSRKGSKIKKSRSLSFQSNTPTSSVGTALDHDANVVGSIVLILLVFTTLTIVVLLDVASSVQEAVVVTCAISVCSTTIVSENLHAAHIASSAWGKGVLKMIAMHDLFMVPLLALPELLAFISELADDDDDDVEAESTSLHAIAVQVGLIAAFLAFSVFIGKRVIGAANLAQARMMGAKGELFTLSVVAYALLIASMSERLKLSIEVGAITAGIILMKSPYVPKVLASIQSITSVFGGMYLTSLGMIMSPSFVVQEASSILQLVCLIGMFKLVLVSTTLNRFFDYGITSSLAVGSAMAQISETSLLVMAKAQRLGLVSRKTYLLFIPTTCILLTLAPFSAAQLRRLKMQEVSGNDDGKIPHYLCFLRHLRVLRHPRIQPGQLSEGIVEEQSYSHET